MKIGALSSCAAKEIVSLFAPNSTPEGNLLEFCRAADHVSYDYTKGGSVKTGRLSLAAFYVFTACVDKGGRFNAANPGAVSYGPDFAALLRKEDLGEILEGSPKENPLYAPPHKVQAWIWAPDLEKLQAWWEVRDPGVKVIREAFEESRRKAKEKALEREEDYRKEREKMEAKRKELEARRLEGLQKLQVPEVPKVPEFPEAPEVLEVGG